MKITEGQEQWLQLERQSLIEEISRLQKSREEKNSASNYDIAVSVAKLNNRKREINRILATSEVVKNPNTRRMEIGSKARVFVKTGTDDMELLEVELIEKKVGINPNNHCYTIDSPLGRAIFHKEIGEKSRYITQEGYRAQQKLLLLNLKEKD